MINGRWAYFQCQYPIVKRLLADSVRCRQVQQQVLLRNIRLCTDSQFGRDHDLSSIKTVADFQKRLPITDFEYYRPYVDQVRNGNPQALFSPHAKLLMFAMTSGTTDQPKHIPITKTFVDTYKRGWKTWGLKTHADHMDLLTKDYLHLSSDWQQSQTSGGIWCGNISGLAAETRPAIVRRPFVVPPVVAKCSDWVNRQYLVLRLALASRRIGMIITANPLTLIKLAELLGEQSESLVRDLRNGTVTLPGGAETEVTSRLARRLSRADRSRADQLDAILARNDRLTPAQAWPELSVVAVWMGGSVGAFVPEVRKLYGDCAFRDHGLSASEGRMTLPLEDESNAGLLDYKSSFFEFIPIDQYDSPQPTIVQADELIQGESYYILLTNSGGLFRYNIRDVVRCVGFEGRTPLLEFLHKGAHCTNIAGEKLTEYQVAAAVRKSFEDLKRSVETVMLVPLIGSPPRYVLLMEKHATQWGLPLAASMDAHLSEINCEYEDRIRTGRLLPIEIETIPDGSWDRMRDQKLATRGGSHEQYKHSFLGDVEHINEQLSLSIFDANRL